MGNESIFHIVRKSEWDPTEALYSPASLGAEGFIHCSSSSQIVETAQKHYSNETDLFLLKIDPARLKSPLKFESSRNGEKFPHIYGPIQREAVLAKIELRSFPGTGFVLPALAGSSVFSKIIRGEFSSYKIFENSWVYCLLTRDAIRLGHALVVPKVEVDHFSNVPDPYYSEIFRVARELSHAIQRVTGCKRVGAVIAGYEVPHCHLHLIPTDRMGDFDFHQAKVYSPQENQEMLLKIQKELTAFSGSFGG